MVSISQYAEDDIIVLKAIYAWRRATPENLAKELGEPYTSRDLTEYLKQLEQRKLIKRVQVQPSMYELTPIGQIAIEALPKSAEEVYVPVSSEKCFYFFKGVGPDNFAQAWACNLYELRDKIKTVDMKSLEFHVPRGDMENWLRNVLADAELAKEFERLRLTYTKGEPLRSGLLRAVESRIQRLIVH